ncbi:hypothetical protein GCM10027578_18440 [Spirosoma luteolum]
MTRQRIHRARLLLAGLFISLSTVQAQKIEVGGSLGGMLYKGDVSPRPDLRTIQPAAGLFFRYNATRSLSFRAGVATGHIKGDDNLSNDPLQQARAYAFRSTISELTADVEYNFRNYKPLPKARNWTPYVFAGLGIFNCKNSVVRARGMLSFPLGVGVKYEIKRPWSVGAELGTRFTRFDYLDGLGERTFGVTAAKTGQSNTALSDNYSYVAITLSYTFYKVVCP